MRKILIIGIGAGNPEHITVQAIGALRRADVLFITDKGEDKADLVRLRKEICQRFAPERAHRIVDIPDPERDRRPANYRSAVDEWHEKRVQAYETLLRERLGENESGAFLVWGDPSLYDSTIRILERITARGTLPFEYEVIPGITSIQTLAARHRITLNQIGAPIHITTGRRLTMSDTAADTLVMLDGECAFNRVIDDEIEIYWGAYLGTSDEILLAGKLCDLAPVIEQVRSAARQRKGWIMDTYLLRRPNKRTL
jgi:precorrin-6A synthase